MDVIFKAIADPTRRLLLDRVRTHQGCTLAELCDGLDIARQSVSKHLGVLIRAGVVEVRRSGRECHHFLNVAPIHDVVDRWLSPYDRHRADALNNLRQQLELRHMDNVFVYTTYIRATPDAVWCAIVEPSFTKQYWGVELLSDWTVGSPLAWRESGVTIEDPEQVVLEAAPPLRLAYTWHTFNEDWARTHGFDNELAERLAAEPRSQVLFELEAASTATTKLTLTHTFGTAQTLAAMCSHGWPRLLSDLKTLLETGSLAAVIE